MRVVGALLAVMLVVAACATDSPPRLASPGSDSSTSFEGTKPEPVPDVQVLERASDAALERRVATLEAAVAELRRESTLFGGTSTETRLRNLENAVASLRDDIGNGTYGGGITGCLGKILREWGAERAPACYL